MSYRLLYFVFVLEGLVVLNLRGRYVVVDAGSTKNEAIWIAPHLFTTTQYCSSDELVGALNHEAGRR